MIYTTEKAKSSGALSSPGSSSRSSQLFLHLFHHCVSTQYVCVWVCMWQVGWLHAKYSLVTRCSDATRNTQRVSHPPPLTEPCLAGRVTLLESHALSLSLPLSWPAMSPRLFFTVLAIGHNRAASPAQTHTGGPGLYSSSTVPYSTAAKLAGYQAEAGSFPHVRMSDG